MKPNKEHIITDILIELEKGTTFEDCFKLIKTKSNLVRSTFASYWKIANIRYKDSQNEVNNAKLNASIKEGVKAVKIGLKTKIERLLILQKLIDECLEQLTTKQCNDTIVLDGEITPFKRLMNQRELNDTRKTLNELQKEISKIEGDYATTNITINDKRQGFIEPEIE